MKNIEHECCRKLINQFVQNPIWPKEIKIAKKLLHRCPDIEAWESLNLPCKISSLAFFLTNDGQLYIPVSKKNPYLLDLDKLVQKQKNKVEISKE